MNKPQNDGKKKDDEDDVRYLFVVHLYSMRRMPHCTLYITVRHEQSRPKDRQTQQKAKSRGRSAMAGLAKTWMFGIWESS